MLSPVVTVVIQAAHMSSFIVSAYILITLINQSTIAVEKRARTSLKHITTIDSEADSNVSYQHLQLLCSNYYNAFHCWTGEPTLMAGHCATYNNDTKLVSMLVCPYFNQTVTILQPQGEYCFRQISVSSMTTCVVH